MIRYTGTIKADKHVSSMDISLVAEDMHGTVRVTDVQVQDGTMLSGYVVNTQEMLAREHDSNGNAIQFMHFNLVVRNSRMISVPSWVSADEDLTQRVISGLDVTIRPQTDLPQRCLRIAREYRVRAWGITEAVSEGDEIHYWAERREVTRNGNPLQYSGSYATTAPGFSRFYIDMIDVSNNNGAYHGAVQFLFEPGIWIYGYGGAHM